MNYKMVFDSDFPNEIKNPKLYKKETIKKLYDEFFDNDRASDNAMFAFCFLNDCTDNDPMIEKIKNQAKIDRRDYIISAIMD
jgi:hypothetical protein